MEAKPDIDTMTKRLKFLADAMLGGRDIFAEAERTRMNTVVGDDTIDTCDTPDAGWETAVVNHVKAKNEHCAEVCILENYATEEEAKAGHEKWVQAARNGTLWTDAPDDEGTDPNSE